MEATRKQEIFGASSIGLPYTEQGNTCGLHPTPFLRLIGIELDSNRCALKVSIPSQLGFYQQSSWVAVWLAVVEINAQCIRRGQSGNRANLGTHSSCKALRVHPPVLSDTICSPARSTPSRHSGPTTH